MLYTERFTNKEGILYYFNLTVTMRMMGSKQIQLCLILQADIYGSMYTLYIHYKLIKVIIKN